VIIVLKIALGLIAANFYEWAIHKYVLHMVGKRKNSFWKFHWSDHHSQCRKNNNHDTTVYKKELLALSLLVLFHLPLLYVDIIFLTTVVSYAILYYTIHRYAHTHPQWGKEHLRWHWDHHMGKNQDANWCILFPMWDHILNTREK